MNHLLWQGRSALNNEPIALISKTTGNKKVKGKRIGCGDCGLCDGASNKSSIINIRHGNGDSSRVSGLVRRGALSSMILNNSGRAMGAYVGA